MERAACSFDRRVYAKSYASSVVPPNTSIMKAKVVQIGGKAKYIEINFAFPSNIHTFAFEIIKH